MSNQLRSQSQGSLGSRSETGFNNQPRPFSQPRTGTSSPTPSTQTKSEPTLDSQNRSNPRPSMQQNYNPAPESPDPRFRTAGTPYGPASQSSVQGMGPGQMSLGPQGQMSPVPVGQMSPGPNGQMPPVPYGQMSPGPNGQMSPGPNGQMPQVPNGQMSPGPVRQMSPAPTMGQGQGNMQEFGQNQDNTRRQPNADGMNQNGMGQMQNYGNPTNQGGMNQVNGNGMGQMQNYGNTMNQGGMNQPNGNGMGQTNGVNANDLNQLSGMLRRLSGNQDPNMDPNDANMIAGQIEQIVRSRGNSLERNQQGLDPMDPLAQVPLGENGVQGMCRMDSNGVSSENAQLEKMLNCAITSAFQKGYQCKKKEQRCCKIKKRRCPQPNPCYGPPTPMCVMRPACPPPAPMCIQRPPCPPPAPRCPPPTRPCPCGGSPGNSCNCQGITMCGKSCGYPPSVTRFENIRPLKIPGFDIFSQPPKCGNTAPEDPVPCCNPCCKPRPSCKPACVPPPVPCRKPSGKVCPPTCIMVPFRPPCQAPARPRRSRKQCPCRPSEYVQSLLEISAALCDQQCALVKLMAEFRC